MIRKDFYTVVSNVQEAADTFRMVLECPEMPELHAGQFVDIMIDGKYLRRPISVCHAAEGRLTLMYKVVGEGTAVMSGMEPGTKLDIMAPLGNGFNVSACEESALLVGGGLGTAPMYFLANELLAQGKKVNVVLGFNRAPELVLIEDFRGLGIEPMVATMDGSVGTKGFVTDAIAQNKPEYDIFYTCGPLPMMKALCAFTGIHGQCSLEERMGCGAGFCYGCACHTKSGGKRVCKDGPVFDKEEIIW